MSVFVSFLADASAQITTGLNAACGTSCNSSTSVATLFANIANAMIYLIGSLSVLMIIFGGVRYVISRGDQKLVTDAKNTILYAIMGVIVAIASFAIVNFVVRNIK